MSILDLVKKEKKPKATKKVVKETELVAPETAQTVSKIAGASRSLLMPHVSEKAAHEAARGVYTFNVPVTTNKIDIRKAVEALYHVNVLAVQTIRGQGKRVRRGRTQGQRANWKKALVMVKPGQKIDLYQGV